MTHQCGTHTCSAAQKAKDEAADATVSGTASKVINRKDKLPKPGERPTKEQVAKVAENIRAKGVYFEALEIELALGMDPICMCGTPILDEAQAQKVEGGGPLYDAVEWAKNELDKREAVTA